MKIYAQIQRNTHLYAENSLWVHLWVESYRHKKTHKNHGFFYLIGGERGIRTLDRLTPTPDFESGTFNHSATSP